jgi:hypothetical protein
MAAPTIYGKSEIAQKQFKEKVIQDKNKMKPMAPRE